MPASIIPSPTMAPVPIPDPTAEVLASLSQPRSFFPSYGFTISAGTVVVDLEERKVLLVFNRRQRVYQLPKGRKNIGEDSFLTCAVRETREETGLDVVPLQLQVATRATPAEEVNTPSQKQHQQQSRMNGCADDLLGDNDDNDDDDDNRTDSSSSDEGSDGDVPRFAAASNGEQGMVADGLSVGIQNNEAAACCHYQDLTTGTFKFVFYYAAQGDCRQTPAPLVGEDEGRFENVWFDAREAAGKLTFKEDGMVVEKILEDIRKSGYEI